MTANTPLLENNLADEVVNWLRSRLPSTWEVRRSARTSNSAQPPVNAYTDLSLEIQGPNSYATLVVETKASFTPKDAEQLRNGLVRMLQAVSPNVQILVVAPWLSERTQALLSDQGVYYFDLTGNSRLRLDNPAVFIETQGAKSDPNPAPRGRARVQGNKAARLIRTLVDFRPPYGVRGLAEATGLSAGYVSRLLDTLDEERLVSRSSRGGVERVDTTGLLRRWAETYDVFKTNKTNVFVAPKGPRKTVDLLPTIDERLAVSGSFAAARLRPVSSSSLLVVYAEKPNDAAEKLDLLPADQNGNVVILGPFDEVVWERLDTPADGVSYVAPSQVAVDCLTGNGRMPAEGEALLEWMMENEDTWRRPSALLGA